MKDKENINSDSHSSIEQWQAIKVEDAKPRPIYKI